MQPKSKLKTSHHEKLGEFAATAISGNDILSSCLYVSGIAAIFAGIYAPLVLLLVAGILYLYRLVYTEVVEALPINGGAYNCLLNGTSKTIAAVAGVMTFLSYIATAVISAKIAVEYLHTIIPVPVIPLTIGVLLVFALLVITGIKDSANVAKGIFLFHIVTLVIFLITGVLYFLQGGSFFWENALHTQEIIARNGGLLPTLYLAFSASLLGVSGFESSANFVEEQAPGVFRKTLRNMWIGVTVFNPLIALVVLNSLPLPGIAAAKDFLLADAGFSIGGNILQIWVVIDAFLVLSGAVLTSYVGVSGLILRMASDACLPSALLTQNQKGAYPRIIWAFFILCSSILLITGGQLLSLAGVYTIAFLGVMSMFAFGNLILKETRTELKRTYSAPIIVVVIAFLATLLGMIGNIRIDVHNLTFFELYFIPTMLVVLVVIYQDALLRWAIRITKHIPALNNYLTKNFEDLIDGRYVAFVHHPSRLYPILEYISKNETGRNVTLVHCTDHDHDTHDNMKECDDLRELVKTLQDAGATPHLDVKVVLKDKPFGPEVIREVAREQKVRTNRILIGSIHHFHPFDYEDLGGVRIIF